MRDEIELNPGRVSTCQRFIVAFANESRPMVQLVFMLRFVAAASLFQHPRLMAAQAAVGWVLISAAFYVLNGISDVVGDRENGSTRPLAAGVLGVRAALSAAIGCGVVGVAVCFAASTACGDLSCALGALGVAYSVGPRLKSNAFTASLTIGTGAGLTYIAGWSVNGDASGGRIGFAVALSCWISAACATKDFSDVEGDRLTGRRTLATLLGVRVASRVVSLLSVMAAACLMTTAWLTNFEILPALVVVVGSWALPAAGSRAAVAAGRTSQRSAYRVYMATQYAVNGSMMMGTVW